MIGYSIPNASNQYAYLLFCNLRDHSERVLDIMRR